MSDITSQQLVVFSLGSEEYALPIGSVHEIIRFTEPRTVASDDLYVNGTLFATGRLMVVDGNDWAVRIETVLSSSNTSSESEMEVARWPESW